MESFLGLMPFLFLLCLLITILLVSFGGILFFKLNKIVFELKILRDELSYHSENVLEEIEAFNSLRDQFQILSNDMNKSLVSTQESVSNTLESKIQEMGVAKKTYDERRWGSLKKAFEPQPRQQE